MILFEIIFYISQKWATTVIFFQIIFYISQKCTPHIMYTFSNAIISIFRITHIDKVLVGAQALFHTPFKIKILPCNNFFKILYYYLLRGFEEWQLRSRDQPAGEFFLITFLEPMMDHDVPEKTAQKWWVRPPKGGDVHDGFIDQFMIVNGWGEQFLV